MKRKTNPPMFRLEDRVLFEAGAVIQAAEAAAAADPQAQEPAADQGDAQNDVAADVQDFAAAVLPPETVAAAADPAEVTETKVLVVINSSVAEPDAVVNDLGDGYEILQLQSGTDAMDAINAYLDDHADTVYSALHIVSHGSDGALILNGETIDNDTLNPADWKEIGKHLSADADILIYGCDLASSDEGRAFADAIADLTGADVAASTDATGGADGDWDLEYQTGLIESATIQPENYAHTLEPVVITVNSVKDVAVDHTDDASVITLRDAIDTVNQAAGDYQIVFDSSLFSDRLNTITLDSTLGGLKVTTTGSLVIDGDTDGDGDIDVVISGGTEFAEDGTVTTAGTNIFTFGATAGADLDVTVKNLELSHAYVDDGGTSVNDVNTGAVFRVYGNLTVQNAKIHDNYAYSATVFKTYSGGSNLVVENSELYNNLYRVKYSILGLAGGDHAVFRNSYLHDNGQLFWLQNGGTGHTLDVISCTFEDNSGEFLGNYSGTVTITDSVIRNASIVQWGALFSNTGASTFLMVNTQVTGTTGAGSDRIFAVGSTDENCQITVVDCTFSGNSAWFAYLSAATVNPMLVINSVVEGVDKFMYTNTDGLNAANTVVVNSIIDSAEIDAPDFDSLSKSELDTFSQKHLGEDVIDETGTITVGGVVKAPFTVVKDSSAADGNGLFVWYSEDGSTYAYSTTAEGTDKVKIRGTDASAATILLTHDSTGREMRNSKASVGSVYSFTKELPSLVVNTLEDVSDDADHFISLREAIAYQKADPTLGSTITFDQSLSGYLELTSELSITQSGLTIDGGVDAGVITIKAAEASRVFNLASDTGLDFTVRNAHLAGNTAVTSGNGGVINAAVTGDLTLNLDRVSVTGGSVSGTDAMGGGLNVLAGGNVELNIVNSTMTGNTAAGKGYNIAISGANVELNIVSSTIFTSFDRSLSNITDIYVESSTEGLATANLLNSIIGALCDFSYENAASITFTGGTSALNANYSFYWGVTGATVTDVESITMTSISQPGVDRIFTSMKPVATDGLLAIQPYGYAAACGTLTAVDANGDYFYLDRTGTVDTWRSMTSADTYTDTASLTVLDTAQNGVSRTQTTIAYNMGSYALDPISEPAPTDNGDGTKTFVITLAWNGKNVNPYYFGDMINPFDGYYSLREAVRDASNGDIIDLTHSCLQNKKLYLRFGELVIDKSITLKGSGESAWTEIFIQPATNGSTKFLVRPLTVTGGAEVTIDGLKIYGGGADRMKDAEAVAADTKEYWGNTILVEGGSTLTLNNSLLVSQKDGSIYSAQGAAMRGGAIAVIENSTLNVDNTDFYGFKSYKFGSAIYLDASEATIDNSYFWKTGTFPTSTQQPDPLNGIGSIYATNSKLTVSNTEFDAPIMSTGATNGLGLVYAGADGSTAVFDNISVYGITKGSAGIFALLTSASQLTVQNSNFSTNTITNSGGVLYLDAPGAKVNFLNNAVDGITAEDGALALITANASGAELAVINTMIYGNTATAGSLISVQAADAVVGIINSSIVGNTTTGGAAITNASTSTVYVLNSIVTDNTAELSGSFQALYSFFGTVDGEKATITASVADSVVTGKTANDIFGTGWGYSLQSEGDVQKTVAILPGSLAATRATGILVKADGVVSSYSTDGTTFTDFYGTGAATLIGADINGAERVSPYYAGANGVPGKAPDIGIKVNSNEDSTIADGKLTLREAIRNAVDGDVITFDTTFDWAAVNYTITLDSALGLLVLNKNLSINGILTDGQEIIISVEEPGLGADYAVNTNTPTPHRLLHVSGNVDVRLYNLTLMGGSAPTDFQGGVVLAEGSGTKVTLSDVTVMRSGTLPPSNDQTTNYLIYANGIDSLTITDSLFQYNFGIAVAADAVSNLLISGTTFENSTNFGAIRAVNGTQGVIDRVVIHNNTYRGHISKMMYFEGTKTAETNIVIRDTVVDQNRFQTGAHMVQGIGATVAAYADVLFLNTTLAFNGEYSGDEAAAGPGLYVDGGTATLIDCTVIGNAADRNTGVFSDEGGIAVRGANAVLTMLNCITIDNMSSSSANVNTNYTPLSFSFAGDVSADNLTFRNVYYTNATGTDAQLAKLTTATYCNVSVSWTSYDVNDYGNYFEDYNDVATTSAVKKPRYVTTTTLVTESGKEIAYYYVKPTTGMAGTGVYTAYVEKADGSIVALHKIKQSDTTWMLMDGTAYTAENGDVLHVNDKDALGNSRDVIYATTGAVLAPENLEELVKDGLVVTTLDSGTNEFDYKLSFREAMDYAIANGGGSISFSNAVDWATEYPDLTVVMDSTHGAFEIAAGIDITIDGSLAYGETEVGNVMLKVEYSFMDAIREYAAQNGETLEDITAEDLKTIYQTYGYGYHKDGPLGSSLVTRHRMFTLLPEASLSISNMSLEAGDISFGNSSVDNYGAMFYLSGNNTLSVQNATLHGGVGFWSGMQANASGGNITEMDSVDIRYFYAYSCAAVANYNYSKSYSLTNSTVALNASGDQTGAIKASADSILIDNVRFDSNRAGMKQGGALEISTSKNAVIRNSTFINNRDGNNNNAIAGALYINGNGTVDVINTTFTGNATGGGMASAIQLNHTNGVLNLINSTIAGNGSGQAGLYVTAGTANIINSIIVGNDNQDILVKSGAIVNAQYLTYGTCANLSMSAVSLESGSTNVSGATAAEVFDGGSLEAATVTATVNGVLQTAFEVSDAHADTGVTVGKDSSGEWLFSTDSGDTWNSIFTMYSGSFNAAFLQVDENGAFYLDDTDGTRYYWNDISFITSAKDFYAIVNDADAVYTYSSDAGIVTIVSNGVTYLMAVRDGDLRIAIENYVHSNENVQTMVKNETRGIYHSSDGVNYNAVSSNADKHWKYNINDPAATDISTYTKIDYSVDATFLAQLKLTDSTTGKSVWISFDHFSVITGAISVNDRATYQSSSLCQVGTGALLSPESSVKDMTGLTVTVVEQDQFGSSRVVEGGRNTRGARQAAEAASLVVNTTEDVVDDHDGKTSLREAITYGLTVSTATNPATITFAKQLKEDGELRINVTSRHELGSTSGTAFFLNAETHNLIIDGDVDGDGVRDIIIDISKSNGTDQEVARLFEVKSSASLTLKNITLYGSASNADGSLYEATGTDADIPYGRDYTVYVATGGTSNYYTGGSLIHSADGKIYADNVSFERTLLLNAGDQGGVILVGKQQLQITNSVFKDNVIRKGGVLSIRYLPNAIATLTNVEFSNNSSQKLIMLGDGCEIYANGLDIHDNTLTESIIHSHNGLSAKIANVDIYDNTAKSLLSIQKTLSHGFGVHFSDMTVVENTFTTCVIGTPGNGGYYEIANSTFLSNNIGGSYMFSFVTNRNNPLTAAIYNTTIADTHFTFTGTSYTRFDTIRLENIANHKDYLPEDGYAALYLMNNIIVGTTAAKNVPVYDIFVQETTASLTTSCDPYLYMWNNAYGTMSCDAAYIKASGGNRSDYTMLSAFFGTDTPALTLSDEHDMLDVDGMIVYMADGTTPYKVQSRTIAIDKNGWQAYGGVLVGKSGSVTEAISAVETADTFYIYDPTGNGKWIDAATGLDTGSTFTASAADAYGLGTGYLVSGTAQNAISRTGITLQFNVGAHALTADNTGSGVVTTGDDVYNFFDGETSLREVVTVQPAAPVTFESDVTTATLDSDLVIGFAITMAPAHDVAISGTGAMNITSTGSLTASGTGVLNIGTLNNSGTLYITNDKLTFGTLTNTGTIDVTGTLAGSGTLGGTVIYRNGTTINTGYTYGLLDIVDGASVSSTGTVTAATLSIGSGATLDAVSLDISTGFKNEGLVEVSGSFEVDAAPFGFGDVTYDGSNQTVATNAAYETLTLTGGGTKTATGTLTANTLAISAADVTLDAESVDVTTMNNSGTLQVSGTLAADNKVYGNVTYDGADQTVAEGTYAALVIAGTGAEATTFEAASTAISSAASDLTVSGNFNGGELTNSGTLTLNGADNAFTAASGAGNVVYSGADQKIVAGVSYNDLTLSGSGTKTAAGDVTVSGALVNSVILALTGSLSVANGTGALGNVTYNGTGTQNVQSGTYTNLTLQNGTKNLSSSAATVVNGTFTAENAAISSNTAGTKAALSLTNTTSSLTAPCTTVTGSAFTDVDVNSNGTTGSGMLYISGSNAATDTLGIRLTGVVVTAEAITYGDTMGDIVITVSDINGVQISKDTTANLGWTWTIGNDAVENATTGKAYELTSAASSLYQFAEKVNVVINQRAITVTADDRTVIYNGEAQTLESASVSGLVDKHVLADWDFVGSGINASATPYTIGVENAVIKDAAGNDVTANYDITCVSGGLTIDQKSVTITAEDLTVTYNGEAQTLENVTVSGLVDQHGLADWDFVGSGIDASATPYTIGVENAVIKDAAGNDVTANYEITCVDGELTINKAAITVTGVDKTVVYNAQEHKLDQAEITGALVNGHTLASLNYGEGATNAWIYDRTVSDAVIHDAAGNDVTANYEISYEGGILTINKAKITVTGDNLEVEYNGAEQTLESVTVSGAEFVSGHRAVPAEFGNGGPDAGTYSVAVKNAVIIDENDVDVTENYDITYVDGTLTITAVELTIAGVDAAVTYNGAEQTLADAVITAGTLVDGQTLSDFSFSGKYVDAGTYSNVMPVDAVITDADGADVTKNYAITYEGGTLTIEQLAVTVTATDRTVTYNGAEQTLTDATLAGQVDGHSLSDWTFTANGTDVGSYAIGVDQAVIIDAAGADVTKNYIITYEGADLTIEQAELTISGIAAVGREYDGTTAVGLDYSNVVFGGICGNDQLAVSATGELDNADAGNGKAVAINGLTVSGDKIANYYLSADSQAETTVDIAKRVVEVTASSEEIDTGDVPVLNYTYDANRLVGSDKFTGELSFTGEVDQNGKVQKAGEYEITLGTLAVTDNYDVQLANKAYLTVVMTGGGLTTEQLSSPANPNISSGSFAINSEHHLDPSSGNLVNISSTSYTNPQDLSLLFSTEHRNVQQHLSGLIAPADTMEVIGRPESSRIHVGDVPDGENAMDIFHEDSGLRDLEDEELLPDGDLLSVWSKHDVFKDEFDEAVEEMIRFA